MYKVFYGFNKAPFPKDIEPKDLYLHEGLKELSSRLDYIKKYRGIMLLTGDPGTGKTTSFRKFVDSLNNDAFFPIYIPLSTVAITDFIQLNDKLKGEKLSLKVLF